MALLLSFIVNYKPGTVVEWGTVPPYPQPAITWTLPYNLALNTIVGAPVGAQSTALTVKAPEYSILFRSWTVNLQQGTLQPQPYGKQIYVRPELGPFQYNRGWTWSYNLNLIGQDVVPGKQSTALTVKAYEFSVQLRSWTWWYNLNLIGQDQFPTGEAIYNRPQLVPALFQTWANSLNLPLNITPATPFYQLYWPLTPSPIREVNLSTWIAQTKLLLAVPFNQTNWPNPQPQPRQALSWTWSYNLNLIGQDKLPVGKIVFDLPPRAPLQPIPIFVATYNKNLIGQDQLPPGEQIFETPRDYQRFIQLRTWIQQSIRLPSLPFNQYSWPLPRDPRRLSDWIWPLNLCLIPIVVKPFNQQDWPLPQRYRQPDRSWIAATNPNIFHPTPPAPPLPNIEHPWVRDWFDRDEWGNFYPGSGIRRG